MPPVPQACQVLADEVAALDVQEQQLRARLPTLSGAAAWAALAELGKLRLDLTGKRTELDDCIRQHSAALQATLVVIDVGPGGAPTGRVAGLWEITPAGSSQLETSTVSADAFSFAGPIPATLGLTVATAGDPNLLGPDFRSAALTAASLPAQGTLRVETVLGPLIRFEQADVARLAASFPPTTAQIGAGAVEATLSITSIDATLTSGAIVAGASGQVEIRSLVGIVGRGPFSASGTLRLVPTGVPDVSNLVDLLSVSGVGVQLPGITGAIADSVLPLIRTYVEDMLTTHLRATLRDELPAAVSRAFVLAELPPDVVVSVRRLSVDPTAITFQPALGAIGTTLSTFTPPAISPP